MKKLTNLKIYRVKAGLTQEELAEKSGISRVTIALIESGKQQVAKSSTILKLADALKIEPQELLCAEN